MVFGGIIIPREDDARIHLGPFFTTDDMFNFDKGLSVKIVYNCP